MLKKMICVQKTASENGVGWLIDSVTEKGGESLLWLRGGDFGGVNFWIGAI